MKITKLSFAALIACAATASFAASDLASAFKEGKLDGRLRAHYMGTDFEDNGPNGVNKIDSKGLAVGGSLIYKTAPLYGASVGVGAYTTQNPMGITQTENNANYVTNKDLFLNDTNTPYQYGKGYSVLAQAYVQYNIAKTEAKAGRMLLSNPFMSPNDTKMIPTAFEAYTVESKDLPNTFVTAIHATKYKERRSDTFTNMAQSADAPDAIRQYYGSTGANSGHEAPGVTVLGVKNNSIKGLELQGWYMQWPSIVTQAVLEANYGMKFGDFGLAFGGRYFKQYDKGAGDIIKPKDGASFNLATGNTAKLKGDSDNSVDTHMYAVRVVTTYDAAKLLLAYSHTDKGGDLLAPWRAFPTDGYTRSMTQTDWNANTKAYKAQIDYDFSAYIKGFSALLSYSFYDRDPSKVPYQSMTNRSYNNGDTRQWNFDMMYKPAFAKNTEFKIRTMDQHNDAAPNVGTNTGNNKNTSNKELRVEANYFF
jgi:hypothetical protein